MDFVSIDRVEEILNELAEEIPQDLYKGLSGGIVLIEGCKMHPEAVNDDLYIMGEYHRSNLEKYIKIYYGSFQRVYPTIGEEELREKLRETLRHEFLHHIEGLSGLRDLEIYDEERINDYKRRVNR